MRLLKNQEFLPPRVLRCENIKRGRKSYYFTPTSFVFGEKAELCGHWKSGRKGKDVRVMVKRESEEDGSVCAGVRRGNVWVCEEAEAWFIRAPSKIALGS